ncbi:MAG: DUF262 domain-containing protein [Snowella sp.]|jgi:hypothetical protein|nr:MAG: DUF262 domain-containing protein [Snowella sp.]
MEDIAEKISLLQEAVSDRRTKLSSDRLDISFGELINVYKNGELRIRPEYQRLFRWSAKQKTALIESILLSIPIPPIFVAEDEDGIWELVDGLQRVATFISFFGELDSNISEIKYQEEALELEIENDDEEIDISTETNKFGNKWTLVQGGLIESLEGFNIDSLPPNLKINLKRAVCRVEILRGQSNINMKYELFRRLNSGGIKLTPQEIRNAIYRGVSPRLNELLLKISQNQDFKDLTQLSISKLNELYDQELILKFFAFYDNSDSINENTENFLNKFMEKTVSNLGFDYDFYEKIFMQSLKLVHDLGDKQVFRSNKNLFVPVDFEGILIGVAQNIEKYKNNPELLRSKIDELKADPSFRKYSGTGSNSKSRIKNRLRRANEIFQS